MQHINDDMDDLFKRAAENYPLKTDSADWNAVVKKLTEQDAKDKPGSRSYKHLLWLLLLLPLGGIYFYMANRNEKQAIASSNNMVKENEKSPNTSVNIVKETLQQSSSGNIAAPSNTVKPLTVSPNNSLVFINYNRKQAQTKGQLNSTITGNSSAVSSDEPSEIPGQVKELSNNKITDVESGANNKVANSKDDNAINKLNDPASMVAKQDSEDKNAEQKKATALQKKTPKQKERGLYAGIVISPDISTVKFQSVKKIGVSMGIIAGYQINKKISIESGVSWDVKNYYSEGQYFNTKNIRIPAYTQIKEMNGVCNMIEVPVTVKYNFKSSGKTDLSASAGVSSYFMKKESYDYEIVRNGQQYPYSSTYKNSSTDVLAVANFAIGYNRQVKTGITLRIEPYIKVPVKGVGIGSLPIMSTGVNIGITKKLSR